MAEFIIDITGTSALLMHNARLADPLDPITKEKAKVSSKRKKTEEDQELLSHLEWQGGLYWHDAVGPYLPGDNVFKSLIEAARKSKDGKRVEQGLLITTDQNPLVYDGPRTLDGLWEDKRFVHRCTVKQQMSRIVRTRPIFHSWRTQVEGRFDDSVLNAEDVESFAEIAGKYIGVGDWRPKHGRFDVKVEVSR
mgnify:CR=1 FL=1